ncbi:MAG: hypothetical protein ACYTG0_06825 [Planctomycetota bacterium]|jgi:hypothetical protein
MCNNQAVRSGILDRLVGQLRPVRPPDPFRRVGGQRDIRRAPEDDNDVVARLEAECTEEHLETSGVMCRGRDGQLTLARPLGPAGSKVIALRERERQPPFNLLTPSGSLVGHDVPVISTLRDYRTAKWLPKTTDRLFVSALTEQIAVFWSVMLPATTSAGLVDLNSAQLQELSQRLGWSEPSTSGNMASEIGPVNLTLVNWHPDELSAEQCVEILEVAQFLARVEGCLHIDMSRCVVWSPTESEVEDIRFCFERADLDAATEALLSSADNSSHFVSAYGDPEFQPRREPEDVAEALIEIERCERQFDGSPSSENRRRRAQAGYEDLVEADLLGPLVEHVAESGDAWETNLGMLAAESLRLLHRQVPSLRRSVTKLARDPSSQSDQKNVMEQLRDRERQIASLTRVIKVQRG